MAMPYRDLESVDQMIVRAEQRIRQLEASPREGTPRMVQLLVNQVRTYRRHRRKLARQVTATTCGQDLPS